MSHKTMNTFTDFPALSSTFLFLFIHLLVLVPTMVVHGATTSLCSQTPFPELCHSTVANSNKTNQETTPFIVHRNLAISAVIAKAKQVPNLISSMDTDSFENRTKSALADCLNLYEDSIQQLNRSMSLTNTQKDYISVQTLLSSALTNHETCKNGFADFNLSTTYSKLFPLDNSSKDICNSLAINKVLMASQTSAPSSKKSKGRRLLDHDLPEWLSTSDHRLLLANAPVADLVVAQDGSGNFKTISEALAAAKTGSKRFVIYVKKGVYKEYVEINESLQNLMLVGDGIDATIVTGSRSVVDGFKTFQSATFTAVGSGLIVRGMTFENTAGPKKQQAVAMLCDSDFSVFYNCSFKGYQDTLYVRKNHQFYRNCDIYGTVDFIFGNPIAVLQNCNIYVRRPMDEQMNTITAQNRLCPDEITGIVLHNCWITAAPDLKPVQAMFKTYLGRPWGDYSRTVVIKSYLEDLIDPSGWLPWNDEFYRANTVYYGEYMNNGSGASTAGRVKWPGYHIITNVKEAEGFSVGSFLNENSWLEATGVPFTSGL